MPRAGQREPFHTRSGAFAHSTSPFSQYQNSLRVNGAKGDAADRDPEIAALKAIWAEEFSYSGFDYRKFARLSMEP